MEKPSISTVPTVDEPSAARRVLNLRPRAMSHNSIVSGSLTRAREVSRKLHGFRWCGRRHFVEKASEITMYAHTISDSSGSRR